MADMDPAFRRWVIDLGKAAMLRSIRLCCGLSGYDAVYHFDGDTATILAVRHQKEAGY